MAAGGSAADVQRELLDSVQKIVRLRPEINDDSVPAFNELRRAVLHASGVHQDSLGNVLGELDAKAEVLRFLVAVHAAKRIYRKQIAAVLTILLQSGAWKEALEGNEAIWSSLPADLRAIAAPQEQAVSPSPASAPKPAAAAASAGAAAGASAEERPSDEGRAPGPSSSPEPSAASSSISPPRRPPAGSAEASPPAPAPRERQLQPQELRALRAELEAAVRPLGALQPHHDRGELFGALRRAAQKASGAPRAQLRELGGDVEPKRATLIFLSDLHDQSRKHRKQIEGTLEVLLKVGSWLREARALAPPSASPIGEGDGEGGVAAAAAEGRGLSEELWRLVESRKDDLVDDEAADAEASSTSASAPWAASSAPAAAKAIASIPAEFLAAPAWCAGQRRGSGTSDSPSASGSGSPSRSPRARAATHSAWSPPSGVSDDDVRQAVEAARLRMERRSAVATCSSPSSSSPWPQAGLKASSEEVVRAHSQLCALVSRHHAPADAAQSDDAIVAFEDFRRALAHSLGSSAEEASVAAVGDLTPKEPVLRFLLALSRTKQRYQSRIVGTLTALMGCPAWKAAGDADPRLRAGIGAILAGQTDLIKLGDGTATSLKRRAADAIAAGGVGVIVARVCAGYDLVNPRPAALPNPYVRVYLGSKSKHTAVQLAALNPQWQSPPFIFEVPSHDAQLRIQVLDRRDGGAPGAGAGGDGGDAPLGHLAFRASSVQRELGQGQQRHRLEGIEHGELEVELRYEGEARQEFTVEGMLEQAIAMLRGHADNGEPVEIFDSELRCPSRHPIVKRKEGLRWHQVLTTAEHRCNLCNDVIPNTASRWRCRYHCDFDVCEACHAEVHGGLPNLSRTKSREYASRSPLSGGAGAGAGGASGAGKLGFGDGGDAAAAASSSSSLGGMRPSGSAAGRRPSSTSAMTRLFTSAAAPWHGGGASAAASGGAAAGGAAGGSALNGRGSRLRCSSASRIAQRVKSTAASAASAVTRTGLLTGHADSYTPLEGEFSNLDVQTVILPTDALEFRHEDSAVFYGVDVVPEQSSVDPWRVMRRYNDFSNLADRLGPHAKCFPEAPFPGKALFTLTEEQVEERRADLEAWLRRVLSRKPMPRAWTRPLYDFCHAGGIRGGAREPGGFAPLPRGPAAGPFGP